MVSKLQTTMGLLVVIFVGAVIAIALLALIPATIAARKGHGFGEWWLLGLLLFLPALIASFLIRSID